MFKNKSWKSRTRLLLPATLILCWIMYSFAIRNTIEVRNACMQLEEQIDSAKDAPARMAEIKVELKTLEEITQADSSVDTHEALLDLVSHYCLKHDLRIEQLSGRIENSQQEWLVETHPLTVVGNYKSLLELVYQLEQEPIGKVVSVHFHSQRDSKTQELALKATIYIQNIRKGKT
jgi:hypothetical protein